MKIIFLYLLISLCVLSFKSFSQNNNPPGCIIAPYGAIPLYPRVYPNVTAIVVPPGEAANIQGKPVYNTTGGALVNLACYRMPPVTYRDCVVRVSSTQWYGGVFAQDYYQCPLDDYILLLILPLGAFGFYIMRKRILII